MNKENLTIIESNAYTIQEEKEMLPNGKMSRREWIRFAMIGGLQLGILGSTLPAFGQRTDKGECLYMVKLSKGFSADIDNWDCSRCLCKIGNKEITIFRIKFDFNGKLTSYTICDDSIKHIPQSSIMKGTLEFDLSTSKCKKRKDTILWGCHQGKFDLYGPKKGMLFAGYLSGTNGFDPRTSGEERCCWPHGTGYLEGKEKDTKYGCEICASYLLKIPFHAIDPCTKTPPKKLSMQLDGIIKCSCEK